MTKNPHSHLKCHLRCRHIVLEETHRCAKYWTKKNRSKLQCTYNAKQNVQKQAKDKTLGEGFHQSMISKLMLNLENQPSIG